MAKKTTLSVRVDPDTKEAADEIYTKLGTNLSTAVNMFLVKTVEARGLPFELTQKKTVDENSLAEYCNGRSVQDENVA